MCKCVFWSSLLGFVQRFGSFFVLWGFEVFLDFVQLILLGSLKTQHSISTQSNYDFTTQKHQQCFWTINWKNNTNIEHLFMKVKNLSVISSAFTASIALYTNMHNGVLAFSRIISWVRLEGEQSVIRVVRKPESNKSCTVSWVSFSLRAKEQQKQSLVPQIMENVVLLKYIKQPDVIDTVKTETDTH